MAIILYSSGVLEEYKPSNLTFTDDEILKIFSDEINIRTKRLEPIPNVWCIWGERNIITDVNYNRLGSEIIEKYIYTPLLFMHDSEISPSWKLTDDIIYKSYLEFKAELFAFIDSVALEIIKVDKQSENSQNPQNPENIIVLNTIGPTADRRMIFDFNPKKQNEIFFTDNIFMPFAEKIYTYLNTNFKPRKPFIIFENENMVIVIKDENVDNFIDTLINNYVKTESYEICKNLRNIKDKWNTKFNISSEKKKRGRPKKIKSKI